MLSWYWPWLIVLIPLPWLLKYLWPVTNEKFSAIKVPFYKTLVTIDRDFTVARKTPLSSLTFHLIWLLLILAAMRPIWSGESISVPSEGRDLMLVVDLSDSMKVDDMLIDDNYVTRMQALKKVVGDFIQRRAGDRIGLIVFGQRSYLVTPLTFDHRAVYTQLQEALPGFAGSSTAIGDAIGLAVSSLRSRAAEGRVVIMVTDGSNTHGSDPREAMHVAAEANIRIHTVGLGSTEKDIVDFAGRARKINPSKDLDESLLQEIAKATDGRFFRAHNPSEMEAIYATIDLLEPQAEPITQPVAYSLYHWPLGGALVLVLVLFAARSVPRFSLGR